MPTYKKVYVVKEENHHKGFSSLQLFEDELDAYRTAGRLISSQMMALNMHNHLNKDHNLYVTIMQMIQIDSHRSLNQALIEYEHFIYSKSVENRTIIQVITKLLTSKEDECMAPVETIVTSNNVDKPCKQCQRSVYENDACCWNCGVINPGK